MAAYGALQSSLTEQLANCGGTRPYIPHAVRIFSARTSFLTQPVRLSSFFAPYPSCLAKRGRLFLLRFGTSTKMKLNHIFLRRLLSV